MSKDIVHDEFIWVRWQLNCFRKWYIFMPDLALDLGVTITKEMRNKIEEHIVGCIDCLSSHWSCKNANKMQDRRTKYTTKEQHHEVRGLESYLIDQNHIGQPISPTIAHAPARDLNPFLMTAWSKSNKLGQVCTFYLIPKANTYIHVSNTFTMMDCK